MKRLGVAWYMLTQVKGQFTRTIKSGVFGALSNLVLIATTGRLPSVVTTEVKLHLVCL